MDIKFEVSNAGRCLTECPYKVKPYVGSIACKKHCEHFNGATKDNVVDCLYSTVKKTINVDLKENDKVVMGLIVDLVVDANDKPTTKQYIIESIMPKLEQMIDVALGNIHFEDTIKAKPDYQDNW